MAHRNQQAGSRPSESGWLAMLVDTFEVTERLGDVPCGCEAISAIKARLARPATACITEAGESQFDLQH
jgi:hypothetical protein